jgi:aminoglycoside phosphotransferase (APT) family kinase protein
VPQRGRQRPVEIESRRLTIDQPTDSGGAALARTCLLGWLLSAVACNRRAQQRQIVFPGDSPVSAHDLETTVVTEPWHGLYATGAAHLNAAAGYYNKNVRVDTPAGPVNVRIPIPGAGIMDLRLWREQEILPAIAPYIRHAPRLLHASDEPPYQVHEFIEGSVLNSIAPRGVLVPPHVPADVVALLTELSTIPRDTLPATPVDWPRGADTTAFARRLSGLTEQVYATHRDRYARQFQAFGFPADPLGPVETAWPTLTRRPLVCVHSDIHRKNMIIQDGRSYFLDWELAVWGDPVYDLAVHFHKMGYTSAEHDHVLALWQAALRPECIAGWERDLDIYLAHEQIKSAIVDTVRYSQAFIDPSYTPEPEHVLVDKLTVKLNNAYRRWALTDRVHAATVEAKLRDWAERHREPPPARSTVGYPLV